MTSAARLGRELLDGTREKIRPLSVRQASHPLTSAASPGQRTERGSHARAVPDRLDSGFRPANPPTPPRSLGTPSALRAGRPLLTRPAGRSADRAGQRPRGVSGSAPQLSTGAAHALDPGPRAGHGCDSGPENEVSVMHEIDTMQARVEAADGLAGTLAAGWDAFELLLVTCEQCEDRSDELFAAFSFAAAAAAEGRNILTDAPSLPPGPDAGTSQAPFVEADLEKIADALASLAGVLSSRLSSAGRQAHGTADQAACRDAAREARRIRELLARGGS